MNQETKLQTFTLPVAKFAADYLYIISQNVKTLHHKPFTTANEIMKIQTGMESQEEFKFVEIKH